MIADQIIVEKDEDEGDEERDEASSDEGAAKGKIDKDNKHQAKLNKINKLVEDSTKSYKIQQQKMGIQKVESEILGKAKRDQKKIDEFRKRFREAMVLGSQPITNQLRNYSE